jgi:hypothetical protein
MNPTSSTPKIAEYECECLDDKKFIVVFDGDSTGNYIIEYCQKCYDSDDKQFMISMEILDVRS